MDASLVEPIFIVVSHTSRVLRFDKSQLSLAGESSFLLRSGTLDYPLLYVCKTSNSIQFKCPYST